MELSPLRGWLALVFVAASTLACGERNAKSQDEAQVGPSNANQPSLPINPAECPPPMVTKCGDARSAIENLQSKRDAALVAKDGAEVAKLSLQLNKELETLQMLKNGITDPQAYSALETKYAQLQTLLEQAPQVAPAAGGIIYDPRELAAVARVYEDYGDLYIAETPPQLNGGPGSEELSVARPWAGYWYPLRGQELYNGPDAPLAKLDTVLSRMGRVGKAASTERNHSGQSDADSWEGRCAAWALAAIHSPEPLRSVTFQGVEFSPADQKALLTLAHERYPSKIYGIRYDGDASTDGTFQSMRPEAFQRVFMTELGERRRAFVLNDDPSTEIWSKPVYRMRWVVTKDPDESHAYLVTAMPYVIRNRDHISDAPTSDADRAAPKYEYRLYVDPEQTKDGKYKVIAGEWLGSSREVHPHYVQIPLEQGSLGSINHGVTEAMDVITQITSADTRR